MEAHTGHLRITLSTGPQTERGAVKQTQVMAVLKAAGTGLDTLSYPPLLQVKCHQVSQFCQ